MLGITNIRFFNFKKRAIIFIMMKGLNKLKSYLKYFIALLLFGSNGIVASSISLTSYEIVLLRTFIGSLLLILIFLLTRQKFTFYKNKKHLICLIVSGMAMGTSWIFLFEAYAQIGVSIASLAYYCGPVIVMALSPIIFKERLTVQKILCFIAVLIGISLINIQAVSDGKTVFGLFCGGMSAVMYAVMVIFNKKAESMTGLENSTLQLFVSFITVAIFVGIKQGFNIHIPKTDIIPILVLGLVNTGIGCYFYFSSIGKLPVQTVAVCGYLEPLSAVIFSVVFLHEDMSFTKILGAVFIIGGAVISELKKQSP